MGRRIGSRKSHVGCSLVAVPLDLVLFCNCGGGGERLPAHSNRHQCTRPCAQAVKAVATGVDSR